MKKTPTQVTGDMDGDMKCKCGDIHGWECTCETTTYANAAVSKSQVTPPAATIIPPSAALLEAFRS